MGRSPPRFATASQADFRPSSPGRRAPAGDNSQLAGSPRPSEDLEVLRRHLVGRQPGSPQSSYRTNNAFPAGSKDQEQVTPDDPDFSSLQLQGGDTTRHIYRYAEKREKEQAEAEQRESGRMRRSMSVYLPRNEEEEAEISNIQMPGGFRRNHLRRAAASPAPSSINPRQREYGTLVGEEQVKPAPPRFLTNNFIEFLTLYGHFAGEDLDEDDEVLGPDEYFSSDAYDDATTEGDERRSEDGWGEDSALLTPGKRKRKRKTKEAGTGSPMGAAMLLLKSFVGTGVLFLPRAYLNGGMMFSNIVLLLIAIFSYYCFILLVSVRLKVKASFGDMGGIIFGKHFRNMINFSLVISQIGFSSAYIVFVGENLQAFIEAVSACKTSIDIKWVILMQMVIFLPLSLYRNINHIQKMALAADLFILLGLVYIYFYDVKTIVHQGGISDIQDFNPKDWTLFIGTAIFTFEGIGLIIPIQGSMKDPGKFPKVLASVMMIVSVVMISIGALSYAAYGSHTKTVVLSNMRQDNKLVNGVQFIYSVAILLSTPLQIYPAIEITSQQLFSRTGKYNPWIKWKKNVFRFFMVMLCAMIAWLGANDLDKFVSIVGSFACIPLVYIYPVSITMLTSSKNAKTNLLVLAFDALPSRRYPPMAANRRHPARDPGLRRHGLHHWHYCYQLGEWVGSQGSWVLRQVEDSFVSVSVWS
jgi:proton-coupled amino acid transporter